MRSASPSPTSSPPNIAVPTPMTPKISTMHGGWCRARDGRERSCRVHASYSRRRMRKTAVGILSAVFSAGVLAGSALSVRGAAQQPTPDAQCGAVGSPQVRTTLYFGLARPKGAVSELEWQLFLRDEVTAGFPEGLTVWEAEGQWRRSDGVVDHERSKVLLLVHADTPVARAAVQRVIERYRRSFDQQSVLWETARVCAAS